ncbi:DegT/DnrJ/EryC1/StrS aminotransferase (plasmid) [Arthrobacter sp. ZXY-2]|nr:DegT/DnrJ/EryC1/StrS aminotransferase [Arthrobacter sp. ZXY-2]
MVNKHPDHNWIDGTISVLQRWLEVRVASPTSQLTGGGAVGRVEDRLSAMHANRPVLLMPGATYGMLSVLTALRVGPGDEVLIPALDWPSTLAAVRTLGATPVPVAVSPDTLTIDPTAAANHVSTRTRAIVACHLMGVPADVPALRAKIPHLPIIEDCAQAAIGSAIDGELVGTLGEAAVYSFGPGKTIDVGEGGAVVLTSQLHGSFLKASAHPVRQVHGGISDVERSVLNMRIHPLAAVLLDAALDGVNVREKVLQHQQLAANLVNSGLQPLGHDERREIATEVVAVAAEEPQVSSRPGIQVRFGEVIDIDALTNNALSKRRIAFFTSVPKGQPLVPGTAETASALPKPTGGDHHE